MIVLFRRRTCVGMLVTVLLGLAPDAAFAQKVARTFDELQGRVLLGETVKVVDRDGQATRGKLLRLTATEITLRTAAGEQIIEGGNVAEVKARRSGPLWNGAVIGAAVPTAAGIAILAADNVTCDNCAPAFLLWAGIGAAIGVGIDALVKGDVTVMKQSPAGAAKGFGVVPVVGRERQGLLCSIRF
jgi:hypothetical protein